MNGPAAQQRNGAVLALFVGACFASAFLIFLVQPMVGKRILPWFGGVPAVWSLCLAFFQTMLFAGYAYAHLLIRHTGPGTQLALHAALCAGALAVLPVLPGEAWKPDGGAEPGATILAMLAANVALPFGALAATGPLIQAWFARIHPDRSPYPLYAVSNLGSFAALLGYPFWIEPRWALSATGRAWSLAFLATAVAVVGCAALAWRRRPGRAAGPAPAAGPVAWTARALWIALAGCAVVLLMGVTNDLCADTASVPFLWILPLATYLMTFILCFGSERIYHRPTYVALALAAFALPFVAQRAEWSFLIDNLPVDIARYCLLLFGACMVLHGELYRLRPAPEGLTGFYLSVSFGGALGGIGVGVFAPRWLSDYHELPLGLAAAWLLLLAASLHDPDSWLRSGRRRRRLELSAVVTLAMAALGARAHAPERDVLYQERTFFGVLRVIGQDKGPNPVMKLRNGTTLHGVQFPTRPRVPTSYYHPHSGIGFVMRARDERPSQIGVIGLGAGTLATYGRPGDEIRFYELDPAVIRIARSAAFFSYLQLSRAEIEVIEGDARISLEEERQQGLAPFDVLAVDAYSSDALPVHLLTREAVALFLDSVVDSGVVAFHVSSRNFNLVPLLHHLGQLEDARILVVGNPQALRRGFTRSRWVLMSRDLERLRALRTFAQQRIEQLDVGDEAFELGIPGPRAYPNAPLWTDDYSDLLGVLSR